MNHPRMKVRAARKDGRIAAFLTGWELENCIYLEHLATDPACRGGGLGKGLILESIQEMCIRDSNYIVPHYIVNYYIKIYQIYFVLR